MSRAPTHVSTRKLYCTSAKFGQDADFAANFVVCGGGGERGVGDPTIPFRSPSTLSFLAVPPGDVIITAPSG